MKFARLLPRIVYEVSNVISRFIKRINESYVQYRCVGYCQKRGVQFDPYSVYFHGMPELIFVKGSRVCIEGSFVCNSGEGGGVMDNHLYTKIRVGAKGILTIGNNSGMSNACIHCWDSITIGENVNIGAGSMIFDTDFHSLDWHDKRDGVDVAKAKTAPVVIKDYAFIGANSIVLKGVTIGEKSIVGAGSVVACNIPDGEIWAGNPARKIRNINSMV